MYSLLQKAQKARACVIYMLNYTYMITWLSQCYCTVHKPGDMRIVTLLKGYI